MPDIRVVSEVARPVCAIPVAAGESVIEIPVASPAAGKLKSILVAVDDVVAEGQAIAIVGT